MHITQAASLLHSRSAFATMSCRAPQQCVRIFGRTIALDMYEHSYHIDFGAKAAGYVDSSERKVELRMPSSSEASVAGVLEPAAKQR